MKAADLEFSGIQVQDELKLGLSSSRRGDPSERNGTDPKEWSGLSFVNATDITCDVCRVLCSGHSNALH